MKKVTIELTDDTFERLRLWSSSDQPCGCAPGEYHEIEAEDWRLVSGVAHDVVTKGGG